MKHTLSISFLSFFSPFFKQINFFFQTDARRSSHGGLAEANSNDQLLNGPTHSPAAQPKANGITNSSSLPSSNLFNEKSAMTNKDTKTEIPGEKPSDVKKEKKPGPDKNVDLDEHLLTLDQLCDRYKTHVNNVKPGDSVVSLIYAHISKFNFSLFQLLFVC